MYIDPSFSFRTGVASYEKSIIRQVFFFQFHQIVMQRKSLYFNTNANTNTYVMHLITKTKTKCRTWLCGRL